MVLVFIEVLLKYYHDMPWTFSSERKNYNCMMEIMNVAVCEGLREIFKQEWDKHYGATKGVWDDTCKSGNELYNMEKSRRHAKPYLNLYQSGRRSDWDISALSDAILYSNAIKMHLSPHALNKVDELRELRNKLIHVDGSRHQISEGEFNNAFNKIQNCFKVLKLATQDVERISKSWKRNVSISLGTMTYICLALIVGLLSGVLYYWYSDSMTNKALKSFRILPVRPIHLVANRSRTVNAILEELHCLRIRNNQSLTYFYISGNPGSGKSQLARLIGQQYGLNDSMKASACALYRNVFVMTLKAGSIQDTLESYADFARRVHCDDSIIINIINSNRTKAGMKIQSFKTEIAKVLNNVKKKNTWLLIVDNVVNLKQISLFLPQLEDEDWHGGQVLITTQDMSSVPPNSSLTVHISVSEGMDPEESCEFLTNLSGFDESQELVKKIAKELDYQPLALASAAFYVKLLRKTKTSPRFNWTDFLHKLYEGKRNLTEAKLNEVNKPAYSLTMSTAVRLAIKSFAESDPVLKHAFTFLSFVSNKAIPLQVVVNYVLRADKEKDKDDVGLTIQQCCLILVSDNQKLVSIHMHRVVHDSVKSYIIESSEKEKKKMDVPLTVLKLLVKEKCKIGEIALVPHLQEFYARTNNVFLAVPHSIKVTEEIVEQIVDLSASLLKNGALLLAKKFLILALNMTRNRGNNGKVDNKVSTHILFPKTGEIYNQLGVVELGLWNIKQAKKYLKKALSILRKQYGPSHKITAAVLLSLAGLCLNPRECNINESPMYSKKALIIDNSLETKASHYSYLGNKYLYEGDNERAKRYYEEAIMTFFETLTVPGVDCVKTHLHLAMLYSNLGASYHISGEYDRAKTFFNLSIVTYLNFTTPNHLNLADPYYNLGLAHHKLKELIDAKDCFRRALAIYSQHLKSSHTRIALVSRNLAKVLEEKGLFDEANVLYKQYGDCNCKHPVNLKELKRPPILFWLPEG